MKVAITRLKTQAADIKVQVTNIATEFKRFDGDITTIKKDIKTLEGEKENMETGDIPIFTITMSVRGEHRVVKLMK